MKLKEKMKNSKHTKFDKKKLIGTVSKKHIKNGSYTMVMSVIFIAVVVVINMIVSAIPSKYSEIDISSQKLYSIGDDTKAMLKDLDKDVTIYQIAQSGSEDENITNLLKKYEDESKHIKVEQKDPVVNPKFVTSIQAMIFLQIVLLWYAEIETKLLIITISMKVQWIIRHTVIRQLVLMVKVRSQVLSDM